MLAALLYLRSIVDYRLVLEQEQQLKMLRCVVVLLFCIAGGPLICVVKWGCLNILLIHRMFE